MRIKGLVLAAALASAQFATADILKWQVGDVTDSVSGESIAYAYAKIYQTTDGTREAGTVLGSYVGEYVGTVDQVGKATFDYASVGAVLGDDATTSSFYIELFDSSNNLVGQSDVSAYGTVQSYVTSSAQFGAGWESLNSWGGGAFSSTAVPEPTSGLLLLLGAAALGLRRRRLA